ncbi:MAG: aminotransferase DegT [Fibrobacter sp.]|nr:aminotransferase DegT [Fibrobacter sp.]
MRSLRTLPPAASVLSILDLLNGFRGIIYSHQSVETFCNSLKDFFSSRHCFLLSSGKAALAMVFEVLRELHPDRHEVIVPAFNCYSVPSAIFRANLVIRPCEIDPSTLQFNLESFKSILNNSKRILAVCPTHFYGYPSDIDSIRDTLTDERITIIEDAAQVMGGEYNGRLFGTGGDVSIFSFSRGKALSAGEGGVILTSRDDIGKLLDKKYQSITEYTFDSLLKLIFTNLALFFFINPYLFWIPSKLPFLKLGETIFDPSFSISRLHSFQAGLLTNWKKRLSNDMNQRNKRCKLYIRLLDGVKGLSLIRPKHTGFQVASIRFPVFIHNTQLVNMIIKESNNLGLGISRTYPSSIDSIPQLFIKDKLFPDAMKLSESLITLPCHAFVSVRDIVNIVTIIKKILSN